jgi:hypothetical protein
MPSTFTSPQGKTVTVSAAHHSVRVDGLFGFAPTIKNEDAFDFAAETLHAAGLLPEVVESNDFVKIDNVLYKVDAVANESRRREAMRRIALLRYLDEHPPVDRETVSALASDIAEERDFDSASLAERLVRLGWTKPTTKEN